MAKEIKKVDLGARILASESEEYQTGSWRKKIPVVKDKDEMNKHIEVAIYCPEAAIIYVGGKFSHIDYKFCKGCGICANYLKKAIEMKKV